MNAVNVRMNIIGQPFCSTDRQFSEKIIARIGRQTERRAAVSRKPPINADMNHDVRIARTDRHIVRVPTLILRHVFGIKQKPMVASVSRFIQTNL